jgi:membrane protease YdiL (CAAX protease family)
MEARRKILIEIMVFLSLTSVISILAYIPLISPKSIHTGLTQTGALMLVPGLAAVITYIVFEHSLRPVGWQLGKVSYLIAGLIIPIIYCFLEYGIVWLRGLGKYNGNFPPNFPVFLLSMLINGCLSAVLEETGWRGFLVPKLIKITSFPKTALITGLIWAIWHYPFIIYSYDQSSTFPLSARLICFTIFVVGLSFAATWLRLQSGSVWAASILHGSHNVFMLYVFNVLTNNTGNTWLYVSETGVLTAIIGLMLGIIFWSMKTQSTGASLSRLNVPITE